MEVPAKNPLDCELSARNLSVHIEQVPPNLARTVHGGQPAGNRHELFCWRRILAKLTKIIEAQLGLWTRFELIANLGIGTDITQQTVTDSAIWDRAQLLFDFHQRLPYI